MALTVEKSKPVEEICGIEREYRKWEEEEAAGHRRAWPPAVVFPSQHRYASHEPLSLSLLLPPPRRGHAVVASRRPSFAAACGLVLLPPAAPPSDAAPLPEVAPPLSHDPVVVLPLLAGGRAAAAADLHGCTLPFS
ncbi:NAD-dependent succinate-semialdehyde dehydrogenase [Sesbania bispinosa]|nr:NAD-dependent succinate-semialdehyde dehydrogenase [Sesbania bispinosa]